MISKTTQPLFAIGSRIAFILMLVLPLTVAHAQDCTAVTADGVQDINIPAHQWKVELYQGYFGVQGTLTEPGYVNSYSEHLDHVSGGGTPGAFGTPILREEAYTNLAALPFVFADENILTSENPFDSAFFDSRADIGSGFDAAVANGGWQMVITRTATAVNTINIGLPGSYIDDHAELFVDDVLIDDIIGFRPNLSAVNVITYTTSPGEKIEIRLTNREGLGGFNMYIESPSLDVDNNAVPDACQVNDFDGDGFPNSVDLDNDNDGILDTEECLGNTSTVNMTGDITASDTANYPLNVTGNGISGGPTAGGVFLTDINLATTLVNGDVYDRCEFVILSDNFDDGFQAAIDGTQVLYFDQSNWDNTLGAGTTEFNSGGLFDSDDSGRWTPWSGEGNPRLVLRSTGRVLLMVDTRVPGVRLNALPYMDSGSAGWVLNTSVSFDCLAGVDISAGNANDNGDGQATNIIFTANVFVCPDTDGDGISNGRDNDSDGDGCPDALEGAGSFDASDLDIDGRFIGSVDSDGIPNITSGGQASTAAVTDLGDSSACASSDSDNDGLDDATDLDDDNDGILDSVEGTGDSDMDGIADSLDLDSDNDGIADVIEAGGTDADNDGRADDDDDNVDNTGSNGIPTSAGSGTMPNETTAGIPDYLNLDSDGDGCSDANEAYIDSIADGGDTGVYGPDPASVDGNGLVTTASYNTGSVAAVTDAGDFSACAPTGTSDSDNDGITDNVDIDDDNDGILDTVEGTGDTDGDGILDYLDLDSDNDGVPDITEAGGTDTDGDGQVDYPTPGDPMSMVDTNDDGLDDGVAANPLPDLDADLDGLEDRLDLDSDNDGIPDVIEAGGTDDDGDGIIDAFTDTDNDGLSDDVDPIGPATVGTPLLHEDTDGDGVRNRLDLDSDNDGITDVIESGGIDSDGDGTADDDDDNADNTGSNGIPTSSGSGATPVETTSGTPDYLNLDSDDDGCSDANEAYANANADGGDGGQYGTGTPAATGTFGLVTSAAYDTGVVTTVTDATDATACDVLDTDGDGVLDPQEIADGTDPNDPCDFLIASITVEQSGAYMPADCDGDGVQNWAEIRDDTNPEDPCDFIPASVTEEPSGDYLISDCDGDGVTNGTELTDGTDPADPCSFNETSVTMDQSGAYLTADCDGDTIPNGQEITDGTDPNDPCSSRGGVPPAGTTCDIIIANELVGPQVDAGFFRIGNIEAFPDNTVRIYNRWGILVYETTGYDNGDNNFRGFSEGRATISKDKALPVGVYFYIIDFMNNGANSSRSGYLYVIR